MTVAAVVVAGGRGERLGAPKQFLPLGGVPLVMWSVRAFAEHPRVKEVIVVLPEGTEEAPEWLTGRNASWCAGGATRRESAGAGVGSVFSDASIILIHDAARPFVSAALIDRVIGAAERSHAALPVLPVVDTIKRTGGGRVLETLDREPLGRAQTPQGFEAGLIRRLHADAERGGWNASDDSALAERAGIDVVPVSGEPGNLKITTAADMAFADWLVDSGRVSAAGSLR